MSAFEAKVQLRKTDFRFGPWTLTVTKGPILPSTCSAHAKSDATGASHTVDECIFCKFSQLPLILPEMTFGHNVLRLMHEKGFGIEFTAEDALKAIPADRRDWYDTRYSGTVIGGMEAERLADDARCVDYDLLKRNDRINFYDELVLFEDELSDKGQSCVTVRVRVMDDCFFVLQRFVLRVDGQFVRMRDTRLYHHARDNCLLREITERHGDWLTAQRIIGKALVNAQTLSLDQANRLTLDNTECCRISFPHSALAAPERTTNKPVG